MFHSFNPEAETVFKQRFHEFDASREAVSAPPVDGQRQRAFGGRGNNSAVSPVAPPPLQVLGTPTREQIREMNPNYTEFKFPQIKAHPWTKVSQQVQEPFSFLLSKIHVMSERPPPCQHAAPSSLTPPPPTPLSASRTAAFSCFYSFFLYFFLHSSWAMIS